MKKKACLIAVFSLVAVCGFAQKTSYWTTYQSNRTDLPTDKSVSRASFPSEFKKFSLEEQALKKVLFAAISNKLNSSKSSIITLPNAAGGIEEFELYEASNFDAELQAKFPEIRSFSGVGLTDKDARLKLSFSPQGLESVVFRKESANEYIEPYSQDHSVYAVYTEDAKKSNLPWTCYTEDEKMDATIRGEIDGSNVAARSGRNLKTLRLAVSVTAEYSNYYGATSASQVGLVLAAVNATLTRCNGVFERDLALHMNLVSSTTKVFYYSPATDPYSSNSGSWLSQVQTTLDKEVGEYGYDIGHLFSPQKSGGLAAIGAICSSSFKGQAFSSSIDGNASGPRFDGVVMHEMGHQLGAQHTYSHTTDYNSLLKEVASGVTIMSYYHLSPRVSGTMVEMYHQASIAQIESLLLTKTCPQTSSSTNSTPVVSAVGNYTIPKSTPFALTGVATDPNTSDRLTYCWEQNDAGSATLTGMNSIASPTKPSGPNWISFAPTVSPTRYFPQLATVLAGQQVSGPLPGGVAGVNSEALSSVARTLNFRLTVRDNAVYRSGASVGQTAYTDVVVTVSDASGPFAVTAPNTPITWGYGTTQTITWAVAGTTAAPVACANVKISLSTDGGQTFPIVLAASTPNDGSHTINVPDVAATNTARIKIEALGNIFYDISNTNFSITTAPPCATPTGLSVSAITSAAATLNWSAISSTDLITYAVDYKAPSDQYWTSATIGTLSTSLTIYGLLPSTVYTWRVRANCPSRSSAYLESQFTTTAVPPCFNAFEPNETTVAAAALTSGITSSVAIGTAADVDYFKITIPYTCDMMYTLTVPLGVNYDMYVYNSAGVLVAAGRNGWGANESISHYSQTQDTYYIKVVSADGSKSTDCYSIRVTARPSASCQSSYDGPNNETLAGASTIPFNINITGLINPVNDVDYYKFVVTSAGTLTLTLAGMPGDYDLKLLNSSGAQLAISQKGGTASEAISYSFAPGTYYAQVYGFNAYSATTCYTLRVQTGTASRTLQGVSEPIQVSSSPIKSNEVVSDESKTNFSIYPNPVNTELRINTGKNTEVLVATLTDAYGRRISSQSFTGTTIITTSKFAAGIYNITITNRKGAIVKQEKIVKL